MMINQQNGGAQIPLAIKSQDDNKIDQKLKQKQLELSNEK